MKRFATIVALVSLVLLAVFLLYPLALVLDASIRIDGTGAFTFGNYAAIVKSRYYLGSIGNSLLAAALATGLACAIGIPLAFCLARIELPGRALLLTLASLPLVLPSFVSAYALVLLFGHAGVVTTALRGIGIPIGSIYGMPGIVIVFTLTLYPYVVMPVLAGFQAVDASMEEAARNLGGSQPYVVRTVLLPIVMPAILAGGLLVFIEALENFGVPAVLAEDRPFLAVDIFKLFAGESDANPAAAGALSVLLIACTALALLVQRHYLGKRRFSTSARSAPAKLSLTPGLRLAAAIMSWGIVIVSLLPFAAVLMVSVLRFRGPVLTWELGLDNYATLLAGSYRPLLNTLTLASVAAVATMLIGAPIGYVVARHRSRLSGLLDFVGMVPFAVSGTILAIGLIVAFNSGPLVLTGGWLILVIAYVGPQAALRHPVVLGDRASARSVARGSLDQSRGLASRDLRDPDGAADGERSCRRPGPRLDHGRIRAERDRRALFEPLGDHDRRHVPRDRRHRRRPCGRRGRGPHSRHRDPVASHQPARQQAGSDRHMTAGQDVMNQATRTLPNFRSDNVAPVAPEILQAITEVNRGPAASYGDDDYSRLLNQRFSALFETEVTVFPVATGTAANALSLAACARPYGAIYCHEEAHVHTAEGGATEAFTGGAKLLTLPGRTFGSSRRLLRQALAGTAWGVRNRSQPDAVSITQSSEFGTVYALAEIAEISAIARDRNLSVHMDGARFANALARLGCSPAEMTWRAGVDILSFGATKNGAMSSDAIVVFDRDLVEPLSYRLRRAGQTWSKMRYASAQLLAYVENGLYLRLATKANAVAARLGAGLAALPGVRLVAPVEANLVFRQPPCAGHHPARCDRLAIRATWPGRHPLRDPLRQHRTGSRRGHRARP